MMCVASVTVMGVVSMRRLSISISLYLPRIIESSQGKAMFLSLLLLQCMWINRDIRKQQVDDL